MGGGGSSIPSAPSFQPDPYYGKIQRRQLGQYDWLLQGLTGMSYNDSGKNRGYSQTGVPSGWENSLLGEATNISPEISRLSRELGEAQLKPAYEFERQNILNTLEANNQLTGSTTGSQLTQLSNNYLAGLTGMQAQYGLADVERALNNRVQLYGTGLNLGQGIAGNALENQNQMNQFALANYENQVAAAMMGEKGGGWLGGLLGGTGGALGGAAGGALIGSIVPGIGTVAGALIGGGLGAAGGGLMGSQSMSAGQSMFSSGMNTAGMYAGSKLGGQSVYAPQTYSSGAESVTDVTRNWNYGGSGLGSNLGAGAYRGF
jgi:hypothetical protein